MDRASRVYENIVDNYFWCSICTAEAAQIEHQIYTQFVHPIISSLGKISTLWEFL